MYAHLSIKLNENKEKATSDKGDFQNGCSLECQRLF